jgi:hypothetical protein
VIPRDYISEWRAVVPWVQDFQVEQDLVISRALVEIFSHPLLRDALAFRGGTALYKLHLKPAALFRGHRSCPDTGRAVVASGHVREMRRALPVEKMQQPKSGDFHLSI